MTSDSEIRKLCDEVEERQKWRKAHMWTSKCSEDVDLLLSALRERMEADRWIPCSERMPEPRTWVEVCNARVGEDSHEIAEYRVYANDKYPPEWSCVKDQNSNERVIYLRSALRCVIGELGGATTVDVSDQFLAEGAPEAAKAMRSQLSASQRERDEARDDNGAWVAEIIKLQQQLQQMKEDTEILDWMQERTVDTIYFDDGQIIDVRGNSVRESIIAARALLKGEE